MSTLITGGVERQGSYYDDDVVQKATVAMVVDDPEQKENMSSIFDAGRTHFSFFQRNLLKIVIFHAFSAPTSGKFLVVVVKIATIGQILFHFSFWSTSQKP